MIKAGDVFKTPSLGKVDVGDFEVGGVLLHLRGAKAHAAIFGVEDIKAFRRFLKKLQKQLELQRQLEGGNQEAGSE
ncbi:hypothetical protein [Nitrosovibrio tenuis]|uniref:Uncharacterized protein n=1 Tax=Nitrosovibrio tenuis TaxID=1233 RepID=A0A1H7RX45_9PROT|nr:hypothetical protein [Nitrosovibrio tenuis]SEL64599.1 hypothetical protein SAMN05216387_1214 [Nitrosovibrio tenuis]